jgi:hypothetical protein
MQKNIYKDCVNGWNDGIPPKVRHSIGIKLKSRFE